MSTRWIPTPAAALDFSMLKNSVIFITLAGFAGAHWHGEHQTEQMPLTGSTGSADEWLKKYGAQKDLTYTGPLSFAQLDYARCLETADPVFDIAILGMPFDTAVSYRPGARFGPTGIRIGSRRHFRTGFTLSWDFEPYKLAKVVDCGDIPINAFDNAVAIDQMEVAYSTLLARPVAKAPGEGGFDATPEFALDGKAHPRIVTLGGDHTIVLPILRALGKVYGYVSVIHFDSHFDTGSSKMSTHWSYFHIAREEGLIRNTSIHAGIREKFNGDMSHDEEVGFKAISADDIDDIGVNEIIRRIRNRVGDSPVYLSLDIDTVDPGMAPATGTPEAGGWTVREVKRIIRGLSGLNFVGADIVEVAPAYDHADITSIAAADIAQDFIAMMLTSAPPKSRDERKPWKDEL
ncbi:Arginase/deacetylase [Peniophora sp. CONT]|nr:Arginase/deacetylase [Peniophora sp. CONT]